MQVSRLTDDHASECAFLGALVTGATPGRQADDEITLFDTVGFALEDVAIATLAYARLVELGKA